MKRRYNILRGAVELFLSNHGFERAAAISFYAFFSLIPIMLFITAGLGFVLRSRVDLLDYVIDLARTTVPYISDSIILDLRGLASKWMAMGWVSVLVLLSSAELVLNSFSTSLIAIFDMRKKFGFFRKRVVNMLVLLMAVATAFISLAVTALVNIIHSYDMKFFGYAVGYYFFESITLNYVLPFLTVIVAVAVVFRIFSGGNLNWRFTFLGSSVFSVLWEVAKHLFAFYLSHFPSYNKFYGSIGAIMILLVWLFFTSTLFLFSASVARSSFVYSRSGDS